MPVFKKSLSGKPITDSIWCLSIKAFRIRPSAAPLNKTPVWEGNGHAATLFGMVQTMRQERIFRFSFWRNAIFTKSRVIDIALDTEPKLKQTYETYLALHDA